MNLISEIAILFSSYKADYDSFSEEYFRQWVNASDHICAILFALFSLIFSFCAYKNSAAKFQKQYSDEKILFIVKNSPIFIILLSLIWGGVFGRYMLANFWFQNFDTNVVPNTGQAIDYIFFFVATCFILYRFSIIYILSNKRVELISAYAIFNKITKKISILYNEIKEVRFSSLLFFETLEIVFKKGSGYDGITCFANLKKAKEIIEKQMYEGSNNE